MALSLPALHVPTAAELLQVTDDVNGVWTDYSSTFAWTAASSNPTQGNSTYSARWRYVGLHTIRVCINLVLGSTFVAGSGVYSWSLPTAAADAHAYGAVGSIYILDSGTAVRIGHVVLSGLSSSLIVAYLVTTVTAGTNNVATQVGTGTQTWNTNDEIRIDFSYEI